MNYLMAFFLSMIPITELRAAIPIGIANGLPPVHAAIICIIGNLIPAPFIMLFIRKIFRWLRSKSPKLNNWISRFEKRMEKKASKVTKYETLGLLLFVALPLPGTGAWTAAFIASLLDIRLKNAIPMIAIGLCIAAIIVTLITIGVISI